MRRAASRAGTGMSLIVIAQKGRLSFVSCRRCAVQSKAERDGDGGELSAIGGAGLRLQVASVEAHSRLADLHRLGDEGGRSPCDEVRQALALADGEFGRRVRNELGLLRAIENDAGERAEGDGPQWCGLLPLPSGIETCGPQFTGCIVYQKRSKRYSRAVDLGHDAGGICGLGLSRLQARSQGYAHGLGQPDGTREGAAKAAS
jgi:hypothetical protein